MFYDEETFTEYTGYRQYLVYTQASGVDIMIYFIKANSREEAEENVKNKIDEELYIDWVEEVYDWN